MGLPLSLSEGFLVLGHGPPDPYNFSKIMNEVFEQEFPLLAKRYRNCAKALGISPAFGYFFNFCLNAPRPHRGIRRVHCKPHVDWKNLAIGICVVFIYGREFACSPYSVFTWIDKALL
jgi:hypothetical protein